MLVVKLAIATAANGVGGLGIGFLPSPLNGGLDPMQCFAVGCVAGVLRALATALLEIAAGE